MNRHLPVKQDRLYVESVRRKKSFLVTREHATRQHLLHSYIRDTGCICKLIDYLDINKINPFIFVLFNILIGSVYTVIPSYFNQNIKNRLQSYLSPFASSTWVGRSTTPKEELGKVPMAPAADIEDEIRNEKNPPPLDEDDIALLKTYVRL